MLAMVAGAACVVVAHLIGFGIGEGLRELLTRPDRSNFNAMRLYCAFGWMASIGLIASGFVAASEGALRWPAGRVLAVSAGTVALFAGLLPAIAIRYDRRGMADDLIGIYLLLNWATATLFWLIRLRQERTHRAGGFPVILTTPPTPPR